MTTGPINTQPGVYAVGYGSKAIEWLEMRHAAHHAAFFLPHLRPGMTLLDCGCGSGSITVGLAEAVAPGPALGIDIGSSVIEKASLRAKDQGVANARFQVGSAYELPFESSSFDAVFAHALLEHLGDPLSVQGARYVHLMDPEYRNQGLAVPCCGNWRPLPMSTGWNGYFLAIFQRCDPFSQGIQGGLGPAGQL